MGFDGGHQRRLCDQKPSSPQIITSCSSPAGKVNDALNIPWLHTGSNFMPILDDFEFGMVGIGNIEPAAVDIVELKEKYGDKIASGQYRPALYLGRGTAEGRRASSSESTMYTDAIIAVRTPFLLMCQKPRYGEASVRLLQ